MFLDRPLHCVPGSRLPSTTSDRPGIELYLTARVRAAFPAFQNSRMRVEHSGGDHLLLIADGVHAFRFPRDGQHDLLHEIRVLEKLAERAAIAVPRYEHIDREGAFGGYRFIAGEPLTMNRFDRLDRTDRDVVLADTAAFLRTLHDIDPEEIERSAAWPRSWTAAEFTTRALDTRMVHVAAKLPVLASPARWFFEIYRAQQPPRSSIVHGDLAPEHVLIDPASNRLTGIIDFGDVALGDPAQDLACFWNYGAAAAIGIVASYDPDDRDPDLLVRARNHFIRYRFDRLYEQLVQTGRRHVIEQEAALLTTLLSRPSTEYRNIRR